MGWALGCVGMRMEDFCQCTPSEFKAVVEAWQRQRQLTNQEEWERVRMQCLCGLQPHSRKKLSARDVMQFPWDEKEAVKAATNDTDAPSEAVPLEEMMKRYELAKQRFGLC